MPDSSLTARQFRYNDIIVAVAMILVVVMMIIPLPPSLLSVLLIFNIAISLLVLLVSMFVQETLDFSVFPTLILIVTIFRLSLNISTTRQILLNAYAGEVVQRFGSLVIGGNPVVGFIIFLIIVVIQFVVITKGSERVSEVGARFTLDAMPGKQMSIDADLNSGLITEKEAKQRRLKIQQEADFYGSMDGASKFVRGDAIAALIILMINVLGGFIIGIVQKGMSFPQALQTYSLLTVGDGLVTQIPALLISTAAGIIVTRTGSDSNFGFDLIRQLFSLPKALAIASGILILLALLGLPVFPIIIISALLGGLAYTLNSASKRDQHRETAQVRSRELDEMKKPEHVLNLVQVDTLEIELGYNLISLVDAKRGGDLLDRVLLIRKQCALDLGLIIPPVRLRDNMQLERDSYTIKIRGSVVGKGTLMMDHCLAIGPEVKSQFKGIETTEPTYGLPALWITRGIKDEVEAAGFTVVEPSAVVATHLTEIIKKHAYEILSRQDVQALLDHVKKTSSAVVNELVPELLSLGEIQRVLSNLLREGVPIRDMTTILEALADSARRTKDAALMTEFVRQALGRLITGSLLEADQKLYVLTLEPGLEQSMKESLPQNEHGHLALDPVRASQIMERLRQAAENAVRAGHNQVLLCSPVLRFYFKRLCEKILPSLTVISYNELQPDTSVEAFGMISTN